MDAASSLHDDNGTTAPGPLQIEVGCASDTKHETTITKHEWDGQLESDKGASIPCDAAYDDGTLSDSAA